MSENIVRFEQMAQQTVGDTTKIIGLVKTKDIASIIDSLDLEANPRSSKTNAVTDGIQNSLESDPDLFPFKTKGILLASSEYTMLDRGRIIIRPQDRSVEGILDGGHNTLAIGLYMLKQALEFGGRSLDSKVRKWDEFKEAWTENRDLVSLYFDHVRNNPGPADKLDTLVPVELLVPRDQADSACVEKFRYNLLDICDARNANVQLSLAAKDNQSGLFDSLRSAMEATNPFLVGRIEWKPNEGTGEIKVLDIVALAWIPLSLVQDVHDKGGRKLQPPAPAKLYSAKGACLSQYDKFMNSDDVTTQSADDYKRTLTNHEVESAFEIAAMLPDLYDYLFAALPAAYNAASGKYGRITAVKNLNERRTKRATPFQGTEIDTLSPDGFVMPLVYGLISLMERRQMPDGGYEIRWKVADPKGFLQKNLGKIVEKYKGVFDVCDYDPQKVGKSTLSYDVTREAFDAIFKDELIAQLTARP